jgi:hypothetical protein
MELDVNRIVYLASFLVGSSYIFGLLINIGCKVLWWRSKEVDNVM